MPEDDAEPTVEDRLRASEELLRQIAEIIGLNARHPDPEKAWRFERPLLGHFSDMRDWFHEWNNTAQILSSMIDKLLKTVESSAAVSRENREGIRHIEDLSRSIEEHALSISNNLSLITREKPLLMRDLFWLETNTVEIGLILYSIIESMVFLRGAEGLVNTPTYRGLSMLVDSHLFWGAALGVVFLITAVAFACRKRSWRMAAMFGQGLYFGTAGILTLVINPAVLGWGPHLLAAMGAFWVMLRGPSDAPQ